MEIKFRAWKASEGRMVEWEELKDSGKLIDVLEKTYLEAFMQFVGVLDKNNKEVYVGDIIKWEHGSVSNPKGCSMGISSVAFGASCAFEEHAFGSTHGFQLGCLDSIEVVSNIFESPEWEENN